MKPLDVLTAPWAIQPAKLLEIQAIYAAHLRGERADIAAIEERLGRKMANEPQPYSILDGVAVLPVEGVIAKRMNLFSQISGGVSTELVARDLQAALADPAVHSIVLRIDSPGGTVDGTQSLASAVAAATKPVVTLANGLMASAAYWIGSHASAGVYIEDTTTVVGSIGVVAAHTDVSGAEAQRGIKTTEIAAGKFKRIASQYGPLSEDGRQSIQDQVDYYYSIFVGAVAQARGVTPEKVLQDMADGRMFIGQQAVAAGLVDGVMSLSQLIAKLSAQATAARTTTATKGHTAMTITRDQLAAEAPELVTAIQAEAATAERARIQAVEAQALPGHQALINSLKFDGRTTGPEAAVAVLNAERAARGKAATGMANDAPPPVPQAAAKAVEPKPGAEDETLPIEERAKATWDANATVRAEFGNNFGAYVALRKAEADNRVRVLRKA